MHVIELADEPWLSAEGAASATRFQTTLWTTVLTAGNPSSPGAEAALAKLCQTYWLPVYAFIRKRTPSREQAEDLTQSFFARFLERNDVARAERERGRFRCFLMSSVQNFLSDEHDRATCLKRGGGQALLSLDAALVEEEREPAEFLTPALAFEKRWAQTVLEQTMGRLAEEYRAKGRGEFLECLQPHLWGETNSIAYAELAQRFAMSSVHLRVAIHRLRQRYREVLRDEIGQTVSDPAEIDGEMRYLFQVLSR
ncbi:MAG TPA: sigma-70 family RNA polymerase sigma factor [Dongiaceae bacterium]|nr:sigma-70 family RNA polymerase sigma factor [Dongiaceae bacterium]